MHLPGYDGLSRATMYVISGRYWFLKQTPLLPWRLGFLLFSAHTTSGRVLVQNSLKNLASGGLVLQLRFWEMERGAFTVPCQTLI